MHRVKSHAGRLLARSKRPRRRHGVCLHVDHSYFVLVFDVAEYSSAQCIGHCELRLAGQGNGHDYFVVLCVDDRGRFSASVKCVDLRVRQFEQDRIRVLTCFHFGNRLGGVEINHAYFRFFSVTRESAIEV